MTFTYTDRDGDSILVTPWEAGGPGPVVGLIVERSNGKSAGCFVPVDRVEEVIAGIRDAARTAAAHQTTGQDDTKADPTTADDPTPLRWGLGDVLHGDDDTTIVCLSGPDRKPYWLELEPERAAALRDDLAPPRDEQPAEAQATDRAAVLDDAIKAVLGRVEAYEGMGQDAVDRNRERSAIAALLRRMAEEARS